MLWLFLFDSTYCTLYFPAFLLSVSFLHLSDEQQPELYTKDMENLCDSATKGSEDTYDFLYLLTGHEPNAYDLKETYVESYKESLTHPQFSEQGFLQDVEYDDTALEDMLREVYHSQREGLSLGQSPSYVSERTRRSVGERTGRPVRPRGQGLHTEHAQIRTLFDRQKEQILAECHAEITNSRLVMTEEVYENYVKLLNLSKKNFTALKLKNINDEINSFFMNSYCSKIWNYVKQKSPNEMEELKKFQSSTFDTIVRRRLVEDKDTILELFGRVQELQNEINCMNDSRDFQDASSVRSGNSHVASQLVSFPPHLVPEGLLRRSLGMPCRRDGPPSIWDTHGTSGNVFCKSSCVFFSTLSAGNGSMEFQNRRTDSLINSGKE